MTKTSRSGGASAVSVFHLSSPERAKRVAKSLADEIKARGVAGFPYVRCQELVARMYGYRTHQALLAECGKHPPSQDDAVVGEEIAAMRRRQQTEVLVAAGIEPIMAQDVVRSVAPTRRADPRKGSLYRRLGPEARAAAVAGRDDYVLMLRRGQRPIGHWRADGPDGAFGSVEFTEEIEALDQDEADEAIHELLDAHDAGLGFADLRCAFLADLDSMVATADNPHDVNFRLPGKTAKALYRRLHDRYEAMIADGDGLPRDMLGDFVDRVGFISHTFDAAQRSGPGDAMEYVSSVLDEIDDLVEEGATLADLAIWIGSACGVGPVRHDGDDGDVLACLPEAPTAFPVIASDAADEVLLKAFDGLVERGTPVCFGDEGGVFCDDTSSDTKSSGYLRNGVGVLGCDVLASAHVAGLSLRDFLTSAVVAASSWMGRFKGERRDAWMAMFASLPDLGGRYDRDLASVAAMTGFLAGMDADPATYRAGLDTLTRLADAGMTLADLGAYAWVVEAADVGEGVLAETDFNEKFAAYLDRNRGVDDREDPVPPSVPH